MNYGNQIGTSNSVPEEAPMAEIPLALNRARGSVNLLGNVIADLKNQMEPVLNQAEPKQPIGVTAVVSHGTQIGESINQLSSDIDVMVASLQDAMRRLAL